MVFVSLILNFVKRPSRVFLKDGGFIRIQRVKKNLNSSLKELDLPFKGRVLALILLRLHRGPVSDLSKLFIGEEERILPICRLRKLDFKRSDLKILLVNHCIFLADLLSLEVNLLFADFSKLLG